MGIDKEDRKPVKTLIGDFEFSSREKVIFTFHSYWGKETCRMTRGDIEVLANQIEYVLKQYDICFDA